MQRKPSDVIADSNILQPGAVFLVDKNNNLVTPGGSTQAGYVALSSPSANTNAGTDTVLTFSSQANHFLIQNNTSANVYIELDTAASTASVLLLPGATWRDDIQVTAIHVYTAAVQPVNAANGIVVKGWL
jgi:hypothetical protein